MPVLSNSLVTRALSPAELEAAGLKAPSSSPTRARCAFTTGCCRTAACRSAAAARPWRRRAEPAPPGLLKAGLAQVPQSLRDVDVDYSWWGWVDVSHDMMPRVTQPDPAQQVYYAFGYGGNGVSFSAHAGRRLAQRLMGQDGLKWDPADLRLALAGPSARAVPPARPEPAVPLVLPARRDVVKTGPARRLRPPPACGSGAPPGQTGDAGSICSSRIEVKPIRRKLRGALASSMKNTLPGSITTPSASAASASSAASRPGRTLQPAERGSGDGRGAEVRQVARQRARQLGAAFLVLLRLAPQQRMVVAQRDEQREARAGCRRTDGAASTGAARAARPPARAGRRCSRCAGPARRTWPGCPRR